MTVRVAIVGSGPSGFYTADALLRSDGDYEIDIIDRLPTPFGLIRRVLRRITRRQKMSPVHMQRQL